MEGLRKNAALGRPRAGEKGNMCALASSTTQKQIDGLYAKGAKSAAEKSSSLQEESDLFQELWSKFRWSIGTTLKMTYTKRSGVGDIARMLARSCASLDHQVYLEGGREYRVGVLAFEREEKKLFAYEQERSVGWPIG